MDLLQYTFFQHALIGSLLASIVCGLIGTYIVTRRLVFISGGLTHASFGGIGLGLYTGVSPILAAGVFAVLSAFGVEWLSKRNDMREDSAIAVFWTLGMALGIMFTFLSPGFAPDLSAYLFGNILTITFGDIALLAGLAVILAIFFILYLRPIIYVAFDREFARSQGIPVQIFEYVLMMFIALTIVACLRMVGIVLVISLLTIPQMTANLFTHRFHRHYQQLFEGEPAARGVDVRHRLRRRLRQGESHDRRVARTGRPDTSRTGPFHRAVEPRRQFG